MTTPKLPPPPRTAGRRGAGLDIVGARLVEGGGVAEGFYVRAGGGDARGWRDGAGAGTDQAGGVFGGGQRGDRGELGDREQITPPEPAGGNRLVGAHEAAPPVGVVIGVGRVDRGDAVGAAPDPSPCRLC